VQTCKPRIGAVGNTNAQRSCISSMDSVDMTSGIAYASRAPANTFQATMSIIKHVAQQSPTSHRLLVATDGLRLRRCERVLHRRSSDYGTRWIRVSRLAG